MEKIIQTIKERIAECRLSGSMFTMPDLRGCSVSVRDLSCSGTVLSHRVFTVSLSDGRSVTIDYQSRDKSKTFSIVPDRSCVRVECSDHSKDFSDSWDESL